MRKLLLVIITLVLALAAAACSSGDDDEESAADAGGGQVAAEGQPMPVAESAPGGTALPPLGPRVIQTAALTLSVQRDGFDSAVSRARSIATGLGGFVVSSSASQGDERRLVRGSLVVRVPERGYAQAIERLSELGRVEAREESGQDVSQELVDLEARGRHLEAVERQLLELLERADTVQAALAVQAQLNQVQLELEQVRGRLRYLDDQVSFATISLELRERQVAPAADDGGPWGVVDAWGAAGRGFVAVVGWIFVVAATIAPVALLLVLAYLAVRLLAGRGLRPRRSPSA